MWLPNVQRELVMGSLWREGYLFKMSRMCILSGSLRELLVQEAYGGGLNGHFVEKKTYELLKEYIYIYFA